MAEKLIDTALTTIDRVKDELGLSAGDSSTDNTISRYINEATDFIESYLGTQFKLVEGHEEVLTGSSDNYLILKHKPIVKINSIKMGDYTIDDYLVNEDDYKSGMIYRDNGWRKTTFTRGLTGDQFGEKRSYVVNYDYGYVLPKDAQEWNDQTLPRDLEGVAIRLAVSKFKENQRDSYGLKELKQGRLTYKFTDVDLDKGSERVLRRYKGFGVW